MTSTTLAERLVAFWRSLGLKIRPGGTEAALVEFETRYGVVIPPDMRTYFIVVDGMSGECDDQRSITFWPLAEVKPVEEEAEASGYASWQRGQYASYFLFADFLIWSHGYAIRLSPDPDEANPVVIVDSEPAVQVASSFSDFLAKYLADDRALYTGETNRTDTP